MVALTASLSGPHARSLSRRRADISSSRIRRYYGFAQSRTRNGLVMLPKRMQTRFLQIDLPPFDLMI